MKKYKLILNEDQVAALSAACELLARVGIGQFEKVLDFSEHQPGYIKDDPADMHVARELLLRASNLMTGMRGDAGWSIGNQKDVPDRFRVAYDMHQVIRGHYAEQPGPWLLSEHPSMTISDSDQDDDSPSPKQPPGAPLSVVCPRCKAKVGEDCRSKVGAKTNPHMPRRDEARLKAATRR